MTTAMNDLASRVKRAKFQLIAGVPVIAEACLLPLVFIFFICGWELSQFASSLKSPPTLSFLRDQYQFLLLRGVDPVSAALPLRLFEILIWILIPVGVLRVSLCSLLFTTISTRKVFQSHGISIIKFYLAFLFMLLLSWGSMDLKNITAVPSLDGLLTKSPFIYIFLEAFSFVFMAIVIFEALVLQIDIAVTPARARRSCQSICNSERLSND